MLCDGSAAPGNFSPSRHACVHQGLGPVYFSGTESLQRYSSYQCLPHFVGAQHLCRCDRDLYRFSFLSPHIMARSFYPYEPSTAAAAIFAVLYGLSFVGAVVQFIRLRTWVWIIMVLAGGMEAFGFIFRAVSTKSVDNREIYIVQFTLVILAPVLMAAAYYILFVSLHSLP